jgi:hypothetical protein
MLSADEIIDALGALSGPDRNKIRAVLALLAPADRAAAKGQLPPPELVWDAVRSVLGPHIEPYPRMKKTKFAKRLREGSEAINAYSVRYMPKLTYTQRVAATRQMVQALVLWMEKVEIPISSGSIATNLSKVPEAVDQQFPGYAEAGRLAWALMMISKE